MPGEPVLVIHSKADPVASLIGTSPSVFLKVAVQVASLPTGTVLLHF